MMRITDLVLTILAFSHIALIVVLTIANGVSAESVSALSGWVVVLICIKRVAIMRGKKSP